MLFKKMKSNLVKVIQVFKEKKIGHLVVKNPKHLEKEFFAILTKTDFLLYILRSYRANIEEKNFLELKIKDLKEDFIKDFADLKTLNEN